METSCRHPGSRPSVPESNASLWLGTGSPVGTAHEYSCLIVALEASCRSCFLALTFSEIFLTAVWVEIVKTGRTEADRYPASYYRTIVQPFLAFAVVQQPARQSVTALGVIFSQHVCVVFHSEMCQLIALSAVVASWHLLTLFELQSRFRDILLKLQVICPQLPPK